MWRPARTVYGPAQPPRGRETSLPGLQRGSRVRGAIDGGPRTRRPVCDARREARCARVKGERLRGGDRVGRAWKLVSHAVHQTGSTDQSEATIICRPGSAKDFVRGAMWQALTGDCGLAVPDRFPATPRPRSGAHGTSPASEAIRNQLHRRVWGEEQRKDPVHAVRLVGDVLPPACRHRRFHPSPGLRSSWMKSGLRWTSS